MNYPIINDDTASSNSIHADNIMTHGYFEAARILRRKNYCFSLAYFATFGRMPSR